ncbi:hypothetical protein WME76_20485 [Sorangium sp. So ce119]|uniref:hypothetical protein n=1 Tax=Sorangium sp. So ce119 TaxID=3133279 RepID=UPI003F5EB629
MDNRTNPEHAAGTSEPEHQGPRPVPYTYHDGREDYLHVGRQGGTETDQPEALIPPSQGTSPRVQAAAVPPEATALPPEATALPPEATALPPEAMPQAPRPTAPAAEQRPRQGTPMREIVTRGLRTGAVMTAATMCTMMAASTLKRGSPWASMNAMATAVGVGGRRVSDRFDPVVTPVGIATLAGGLLAWGIGYEKALDAAGRRGDALTGALSAFSGFLLDELVLPDRLMKNFRDKMGVLGTFSKYVALGVASGAAPRR